MRMTNIKYGSRKVKPPHVETSIGKRHMFPIPTAEPMQAMISATGNEGKMKRLCLFDYQPPKPKNPGACCDWLCRLSCWSATADVVCSPISTVRVRV